MLYKPYVDCREENAIVVIREYSWVMVHGLCGSLVNCL